MRESASVDNTWYYVRMSIENCMNQSTTQGQVTEILPDLKYRVTLGDGREILVYCAGKMNLNKIKVLVGDTVDVVLDPHGGKCTNRITRRV
jgi:translation initiation factor IF-1